LQKITVLVNRAARNGCDRRRLDAVRQEFADCDLHILTPDSYEALTEAARAATQDGTDRLLVIGGDGTVNAVLNAIAHTSLPLGIVPAGTANDLATQLGIPRNPRRACRAIRRGQAVSIDLLRLNERYFATAGGLGVLADTAVGVNVLKARAGALRTTVKLLGSMVYVLYSFMLLLFSRKILSDVTVTVDGQALGTVRTVALFANNQPTIGKFVCSFPAARMTDGLAGVCLMRERGRWQSILTVILMSLKGRHAQRRDVLMLEGRHFTLTSPDPKVFIGDGEVLAESRHMELSVVPGALRVIGGGRLLADDAHLEVRVEEGAVTRQEGGALLG
jgi:YegS/Rv2252/BmrU family lipid kinase